MISASRRQIVVSTGAERRSWKAGNPLFGGCMSAGRGILIISSTVVGTILGSTLPTSGSVPVFTGQRSTPGLVACSGSIAAARVAGSVGPTLTPAAALIWAATLALTTGIRLTSWTWTAAAGGTPPIAAAGA